jgi:uncharacterized protein (DUF1697 family)
MATFVALLRGINVGGKSTIPMADLRQVFAGLGYENVQTYIQSGNVIFGSRQDDAELLIRDIEKAIAERFGKDVTVLLRTASQLDDVLTRNPFLGRQDDLTKLLVTFLAAEPDAESPQRLRPPAGETGELAVIGREVYLHVPDGYGRSKISNAFLEKKLGVAATTRNWKSIRKLRDLAAG